MLQLSLECIRTTMAEVSVTKQEISQVRKWQTRAVGIGKIAVTIQNRIARRHAIASCRTEGEIAGFDLVQIDAID